MTRAPTPPPIGPARPRPGPRPATEARRQDLRTRLVDAAEHSIARSGLRDLRARPLAEAAGCSVGAIYGVFPDLDALVLEVNARTLATMDQALRAGTADHPPATRLISLAAAYLDFAATHRPSWDALFQHRMASGQPFPDWFRDRQRAAFLPIEPPLAALCPTLAPEPRARLARSLFACVHGVVLLGLEGTLEPLGLPALHTQLRTVVTALADGLRSL